MDYVNEIRHLAGAIEAAKGYGAEYGSEFVRIGALEHNVRSAKEALRQCYNELQAVKAKLARLEMEAEE